MAVGELTPGMERRIELLFPLSDREAVRTILLEQCGTNIPGWRSEGLERLHFAVLKLSKGKVAGVQQGVDAAKQDFRDVLMWAGFGGPCVHSRWHARSRNGSWCYLSPTANSVSKCGASSSLCTIDVSIFLNPACRKKRVTSTSVKPSHRSAYSSRASS